MKPQDCNWGDWHRYFNNGWMKYMDRDIVQVQVSDDEFYIATGPGGSFTRKVSPRNLAPFYPEGGCVNVYGKGMYIERRARQIARRTASLCHYNIIFQGASVVYTIDAEILWALCTVTEWPTLDKALSTLSDKVSSIAISRNLIVCYDKHGAHPLRWGATPVGYIIGGLYRPQDELSCYTKLTRAELQEINAPCL